MDQQHGPGDLRPIDFKTLTWHANDPAGSLERVAEAVSAEAERAIDWYLKKKQSQKRGAQWLRVIAIILITAATLVPILIEIFENWIIANSTAASRPWWASAAWSSVLLIIALALVLLDRFYGCSSAWMRFISAELQIREALHAFRLDWQIARARWTDGKPSEQQIEAGLQSCRGFLGQIDAILKSEVEAWVQEFRSALKDIDEAVKARPAAARAAGANIIVENGERCPDGWTLAIDGGPPQRHHGRTAALANLLPGLRKVEVAGQIDGRSSCASQTFIATAGSVSDVSLKLE
jgi:hypothetical protein